MSTLEIKDLYAHVETKDGIKPILKGVNLTVNSGETHAIMAPTVPANPPWHTRWPATRSTSSSPARCCSTARTSSR